MVDEKLNESMYMLNPSPTQGKSLLVWMILDSEKASEEDDNTIENGNQFTQFFDKKKEHLWPNEADPTLVFVPLDVRVRCESLDLTDNYRWVCIL